MTRTKQLLAALLSIALVASVGLIATGGFAGAQTQADAASVTIEDQQSDRQTVIVDSVTVPEGGFVVIHETEGLEEGDAVGSVIGVSSYLGPGTHEDVPVTMGNELDTTEVEVTAMAHMDTNGNEVYDFGTSDGAVDGPYLTGGAEETETPAETEAATETPTEAGTETETEAGTETETEAVTTTEEAASDFQQETETETPEETETPTETETPEATETPEETETPTETETPEGGQPVVDTATIDAVGDNAPATNLEFSDQSSDGTTVTVDRVTLYRGGYLVIHDTEELADGDTIDSILGHSTYLAPGTYEDVEITLAQPLDLENETGVNVTAMPHFETNENLVFDFAISFGSEDGPYLENGSAVTQAADVSAEGAATETATETEAGTPMVTETETGTPTATETETEAGTPTETETGTPTETTEEA